MRPEESVELVQNDSGPNSHGASLEVEIRNEAQMPRKINDHSFADCASRQPRPGSARCHGQARMRGCLDDGTGLPHRSRKGNAHRLDLINRGVGRIELPGKIIEGDVTISSGERRLLLGGSHRTARFYECATGL